MASPTAIAAYLVLFTLVGLLFLFVNLLIGRFVRPSNPVDEKLEIYECGEPTIGSSFVQFDLRFYVVALVFIVFDVEVAFLFPLATVLGKTTNLRGADVDAAAARGVYAELGLSPEGLDDIGSGARRAATSAFWAINVFFIILLVGFAYEWRTGAFDWVRAVTRKQRGPPPATTTPPPVEQPSLSA